jgi:3-deoxy-7-phosphoheptulonate synthase
MSDVIQQIKHGNQSLVGVMIESNIVGGSQPIPGDLAQLKYGCSVTDGCIAWDDTEAMLRSAHQELLQRA